MLAYGRDSGVLTGCASGVGTWEGQFLGFFSGFNYRAGEISGVLHNEASSQRGVGHRPEVPLPDRGGGRAAGPPLSWSWKCGVRQVAVSRAGARRSTPLRRLRLNLRAAGESPPG